MFPYVKSSCLHRQHHLFTKGRSRCMQSKKGGRLVSVSLLKLLYYLFFYRYEYTKIQFESPFCMPLLNILRLKAARYLFTSDAPPPCPSVSVFTTRGTLAIAKAYFQATLIMVSTVPIKKDFAQSMYKTIVSYAPDVTAPETWGLQTVSIGVSTGASVAPPSEPAAAMAPVEPHQSLLRPSWHLWNVQNLWNSTLLFAFVQCRVRNCNMNACLTTGEEVGGQTSMHDVVVVVVGCRL
jgi:hypothetical protein